MVAVPPPISPCSDPMDADQPIADRGTLAPCAPFPDAKGWARRLAGYRKPDDLRGVLEIVVSLGPFVALWVAIWTGLHYGFWVALLLAVPAGGFLVRLFVIQHDCGHGAFFRRTSRQRLDRPKHRRPHLDTV